MLRVPRVRIVNGAGADPSEEDEANQSVCYGMPWCSQRAEEEYIDLR